MRPSNDLPAVYLCREAVDFRKGMNGLAALVEEVLDQDPFSEHLFVFCNRRPPGADTVLGAQRILPVAKAPGARAVEMVISVVPYRNSLEDLHNGFDAALACVLAI